MRCTSEINIFIEKFIEELKQQMNVEKEMDH